MSFSEADRQGHSLDAASAGGLRGRRDPLTLRLFEITVAALVLLATLPLMLVVAAVIRLGTPGPALFRQRRVGRNGEIFEFWKFRTMYVDARERFPELYAYRYGPGQLDHTRFKQEEDPRLTPQGRWLRKTSIDELPNFVNVLRGEVALVGPRPEIPEMLPYYQGEDLLKFSVRPGITGMAQVAGRGLLTFRETVDLDIRYVREQSRRLDVWIVGRTIRHVVRGVGAF